MREPNETAYSETLWVLRPVSPWEKKVIPPEGLKFGADIVAHRGQARLSSLDQLSQAGRIIFRCAPWLTAYFAPTLWDAKDYPGKWGGFARYGASEIFIATESYPDKTLNTVHHEIFHKVQHTQGGQAVQEMAASSGVEFTEDYYNRPRERAARLYAHLACFLDEGGVLPLLTDNTAVTAVQRVAYSFMLDLYTGDFARQVAAQQAADRAEQAKEEKRAARIRAIKSLVSLNKLKDTLLSN